MMSSTTTITTEAVDNLDQFPDNGSRRASGRVRKPTAKAVALNGSKSYSPPLEDTIVIGETSPKRRRLSNKEPSPTTTPPKTESEDVQMPPEIPEALVTSPINMAKSPTPEEVIQAQALPPTTPSTPSRRQSLREKKLTPKASTESQTGQKRAAADDHEEAPIRKSARISNTSVKVPSKLRFSFSSSPSQVGDADKAEAVGVIETPKKSKIIVLKYKPRQSLQKLATGQPTTQVNISRDKKSRQTSARRKNPTKKAAKQPEWRPLDVELAPACGFQCLPPWSRLVAMAKIAAQMPDEEKDVDTIVPGSIHDWRTYAEAMCECVESPPMKTHRTNSAELARALLPNTVAQGTKTDPVDLSKSHTPEHELLLTPVNTILKASDAERLSQLYTRSENTTTFQSPSGVSMTSTPQSAYDLAASPMSQTTPNHSSVAGTSSNHLGKRSYEDRIRDDYLALADIRKRAAAKGLHWTYNDTFEDIEAMIVEAEERNRPSQYRQQAINPPTVLGRAHDANAARPSPTGFGVLLPPKGAAFTQRNVNETQQFSAANGLQNGSSESNSEPPAKITKITFVKASDPSKARRPSSPTRQKSSRFRVDPRGLRGESPGPGTIINMQETKDKAAEFKKKQSDAIKLEMKEKAAGLQRLSEAMAPFQKYQEAEEKWLQEKRDAIVREARERQAREAAARNGNGTA